MTRPESIRPSGRRTVLRTAAAAAGATLTARARAQKRYDPGASDTEIRIGQSMPYSGPISMLGTMGKAAAAYFEKVNAEGGIRGRKVKLISLDDGYSPPKAIEATRRLVENDEVLLIFNNIGTPTNLAIHRYLNGRKVPHLLIMSGANRWNDPKNFPWTLSGMLSYQAEARMYARHMLATVASPRIAVAALNPHAGDGGSLGREEIDVIAPAVEAVRREGIDARGPLPSDTVFVAAKRGDFDAVVSMYHDQGQIAMKLMGFDRGVTLHGGLPVPVATCASGTAFDIVGRGIANVEGLQAAFDLVARIAARDAAR
jgi:hypothetical protein